jgi:VWFA-related protein
MLRAVVIAALPLVLLAALPSRADDRGSHYDIRIKKDGVRFGTERVDGKDSLVVAVPFRLLRPDGQTATEEDLENNKDTVVVREDGKLVEVLDLSVPKAMGQLSVVLVLDCSGSMSAKASEKDDKSKMEALHEAAINFIRKMPKGARAALLPFSSTVRPLQPPNGLTDNKGDLERAILQLKADGGTLIYDAAYTGLETLRAAKLRGKKAVIVLTDGKDEEPGSRTPPEEVIAAAQELDVPLYMLGLGLERDLNEKVMKEMAAKTNGRYHRAANQEELLKIFGDLAETLQDDTCLVRFRSTRQSHDGTARGIEIEVQRNATIKKTDGGGYKVEKEGQRQSDTAAVDYNVRGVVPPDLKAGLYLLLLAGLVGLMVLPAGLRRLGKLGAGGPALR